MKTQFLYFILLSTILLLLLTAKTTTSAANSSPQVPTLTPASSNGTVYKVSKQLCFGCASQSLEFLFYHNLVRASKWELPMSWDFQLEKYARWWATQRKDDDCRPEHSFPEGEFKLGENIYWGSGGEWRPVDAVGAWADEEKYYDYAGNSCEEGEVCGHYTQIVWRKTTRVGCARVVCDDGDVFMSCNYDPPGNYVGERPY